jgi:DNA-binding SARP family transcriptional activator/tetratricopeptide (TPR) repeat protein
MSAIREASVVRFTLLGPVRAVGAGRLLPKERAILATLLLHPGKVVAIATLARALWADDPPPSARNTIHGHIKRLRQLLGPDRIVTRAPGYIIHVGPGELDLDDFTGLCDRAAVASPETAARLLRQALDLWQGEALADVESPFLRQSEIPRLAELRQAALEARLDADLRLGRHTELISELRALIGTHPYRERPHEQLMLALYRGGRQAEALAVYSDVRRTLVTELNVEPGPRLAERHRQILAADPALAVPRPADPRQLPTDLPDFTGRDDELHRLRDLLRSAGDRPGAVPVTSVTGPGGIGKTALAVHVAHQVADHFPDGQLYLSLGGMSGQPAAPADLLARLLRDLGADPGSIPSAASERETQFRSMLAGRRVLLVLDDARDAAQVRPLLPGSTGCAVLVTSRNTLGDLTVAALVPLPELGRDEGRELFVSIAGAVPDPDEVLRYCAGLPLAIRIAAARLAANPSWSVAGLVSRLAAEHSRLTELRAGDLAVRASFRLSYQYLPAEQARAFALLGLAPPGSFTLAPAMNLLDLDEPDAAAVLERLTRVHMLSEPEPGRFRLHDLLRVFAAELADSELSAAERSCATRRLVEWYAAALRSASLVMSPGRTRVAHGVDPDVAAGAVAVPEFMTHAEALSWCQTEEAALVWAIETAAAHAWHDLTMTIAGHVTAYYSISGNPRAFLTTQRLGSSAALATGNDVAYSTFQNARGGALTFTGDFEAAIECFREALRVRRKLGDTRGEAGTLSNMGNVYYHLKRFEEARDNFDQSRAITERTGDRAFLAVVTMNAASARLYLGELEEAVALCTDGIALSVESGDKYVEGGTWSSRGEALRRLGRLEESLENLRKALAILDELGTGHRHQIEALECMAATLTDLGRAQEAAEALDRAAALQVPR